MNEKKVSILVAIYNVEKYIGKCIESIINQDYSNIEIILVDDNSQDNSGKICDEFSNKDSRIRVIHHKQNTKLPGVRNTGLNNATGDYIVFVDGDDWLAEDYVSYMLKVIEQSGSDVAFNLINFTTRDMQQGDNKEIEVWSAEKALEEFLYPHLTIGAWNKMFKREVIEENKLRFIDGLYTAEGYRFVSDVIQRVSSIGVGCRKVYYYRLNNSQSATTKYDVKQSLGAIDVAKSIERDLKIKTPGVINAIKQHIWLNYFWNIRQIIALKKQNELKESYKESVRYVKENYKNIVEDEKRRDKKIKYFLSGSHPIIMARLKNMQMDFKLKIDLMRFRSEKND
ncbi:glycosyltransferase family 2 protein [Streptococcus equinus]|uniref:glycosyltransferase family 2 protein n=1 Tax=Streptococcus equinus TaxID=1335 RepID=UPI000880FE09|nr:glycosyltransferase family 2 protein [Streptococcus equinus]SDQ11055.1 Glycosyltransferase involved in cell wall bisynthesis [Streptococcus equinus]